MKIKALLCMALLVTAVSCDKEENDEPVYGDWDDWTSGWGHVDPSKSKTMTPKGLVLSELVKKEDLPAWLQSLTEGIEKGYIMKGGSGEQLLYFVYDTSKKYGRHYDAQGKLTSDNPKLTDWVIIYSWPPLPETPPYWY